MNVAERREASQGAGGACGAAVLPLLGGGSSAQAVGNGADAAETAPLAGTAGKSDRERQYDALTSQVAATVQQYGASGAAADMKSGEERQYDVLASQMAAAERQYGALGLSAMARQRAVAAHAIGDVWSWQQSLRGWRVGGARVRSRWSQLSDPLQVLCTSSRRGLATLLRLRWTGFKRMGRGGLSNGGLSVPVGWLFKSTCLEAPTGWKPERSAPEGPLDSAQAMTTSGQRYLEQTGVRNSAPAGSHTSAQIGVISFAMEIAEGLCFVVHSLVPGRGSIGRQCPRVMVWLWVPGPLCYRCYTYYDLMEVSRSERSASRGPTHGAHK